jgi:hypothetical protein
MAALFTPVLPFWGAAMSGTYHKAVSFSTTDDKVTAAIALTSPNCHMLFGDGLEIMLLHQKGVAFGDLWVGVGHC